MALETLGPVVASTDRPLINSDPGKHETSSVCEVLGLSIEDLREKVVLDIGTGTGQAFRQAHEMGMEYYAIDILPSQAEAAPNDLEIQTNFQKLASNISGYENYFQTGDATKTLPYPDNNFDTVFSSIALPRYALSYELAIHSIIEMIRVSKKEVVFSIPALPQRDLDRKVQFGIEEKYMFPVNKVIQTLTKFGIHTKIKENDQSGFTSLHLNLSRAKRISLNLDTIETELQKLNPQDLSEIFDNYPRT